MPSRSDDRPPRGVRIAANLIVACFAMVVCSIAGAPQWGIVTAGVIVYTINTSADLVISEVRRGR